MRQHGFELLISKDSIQAKQKLYKAYDPALSALTAKPEMVFESATGTVKIKAPIATEANLGPFTVKVQGDPNHMSGTIKPPTLNGTLEVRGIKYKFSADIELKAEVILHPRPRGVNEAPVRVGAVAEVVAGPGTTPVDITPTKWSKVAEHAPEILTLVFITVISRVFPAIRMAPFRSGATTSTMFFNHSVDPKLHEFPDA
jgi:hypothetical protein